MKKGREKKLKYVVYVALVFVLSIYPNKMSAMGFDVDALYFSDSMSGSSDSANSRIMWDIAGFLDLDKKGRMVLGWSYGSVTVSDKLGSTTNSLTISDMGPVFGYYIDKNKIWSIFLTYNLISTGQFSSASTKAEWRGTSYKAEIGFTPSVTESLRMGLKLIYYSANFTESIIGTSSLSKTTNTRGIIYPAFGLGFTFD